MMSKYLKLARAIISDIESGKIAANDKLPSLRLLTQLHDVSMTTAMSCYRFLEQQGYAIAESQRGFYALNPIAPVGGKSFPQFKSKVTTPERNGFKNHLVAGNSFATAQLDPQLIDKKFLKHSFMSALKNTDFELAYEDPKGNQTLRKHLANHLTQQGFATSEQELIITNGCLDAVSMALDAVSSRGDTIAVSSPCYSGLLDMLSVMDRRVIEIPSTTNGLDLNQLRTALEQNSVTACLLTANNQNPSGHSLSEEQKSTLAEFAERYQIPIIEDDVFREISFHRAIPLPIKHYDKHGWVIWCSSFSKTLAPGIRIGWCNAGRYHAEVMNQRKAKTLGVSQPMQQVMADYLAKGHYVRHIKSINRELAAHLQKYADTLSSRLGEQCMIYPPNGGLVMWVKLPGVDTQALQETLAQKNIHIKAGNSFSTTHLYQEYIRLNIGIKPTEEALGQLVVIINEVKGQQPGLHL